MSSYIKRTGATRADDEGWGKYQEGLLFPIVKAFFNLTNTFKQHHDKWYYSDYVDKDPTDPRCEIGYEVKTRECYSTTDEIQREGAFINTKKLWFNDYIIFNFWDKVYFYRVNQEQVKGFKTGMFERAERACGHKNTNDAITYIPFRCLSLLHTYTPERQHNPQSAVKSNMDGAEQRRGRCLIDVSTL